MMVLMKLIGIMLFSLVGMVAKAQPLPAWVNMPPARSDTYYYRVSQGVGLTEEEAENRAFATAIMESAFAIGVPVDLNKLEQIDKDSLLVTASRYVKIPINKVCKHVESLITRRGFRVYVLCQVANDVRIVPQFRTFNCILNKEE